jgi:hypothetical protein
LTLRFFPFISVFNASDSISQLLLTVLEKIQTGKNLEFSKLEAEVISQKGVILKNNEIKKEFCL